MAIGLPGEDIFVTPTIEDAGAVNVIYGSSAGISPTQSPVSSQFFSQDSPDMGLAPEFGDGFGLSLG